MISGERRGRFIFLRTKTILFTQLQLELYSASSICGVLAFRSLFSSKDLYSTFKGYDFLFRLFQRSFQIKTFFNYLILVILIEVPPSDPELILSEIKEFKFDSQNAIDIIYIGNLCRNIYVII